jgi:hypothetical protein
MVRELDNHHEIANMGWRQHLYQAVLIGLFVTFLVTIR